MWRRSTGSGRWAQGGLCVGAAAWQRAGGGKGCWWHASVPGRLGGRLIMVDGLLHAGLQV